MLHFSFFIFSPPPSHRFHHLFPNSFLPFPSSVWDLCCSSRFILLRPPDQPSPPFFNILTWELHLKNAAQSKWTEPLLITPFLSCCHLLLWSVSLPFLLTRPLKPRFSAPLPPSSLQPLSFGCFVLSPLFLRSTDLFPWMVPSLAYNLHDSPPSEPSSPSPPQAPVPLSPSRLSRPGRRPHPP